MSSEDLGSADEVATDVDVSGEIATATMWTIDLPGVETAADGSWILPDFPTATHCEAFLRLLTDPYLGRDSMADGALWLDVDGATVPDWSQRIDPDELGEPFSAELPDALDAILGLWSTQWADEWGDAAAELVDLACQALGGWLAGTVVGEWKASGRYPAGWGTYTGFRSVLDRVFDRLHINHTRTGDLVIRHGLWIDRDGVPHAPSTIPVARVGQDSPYLAMLQTAGKALADIPTDDDSFAGAYLPDLLVLARGWVGPEDSFAFPLQWGEAHVWGLWAPEDGGGVDATMGEDAASLMEGGIDMQASIDELEASHTWLPDLGLGEGEDTDFTWVEGLLADGPSNGLRWDEDWPGRSFKKATPIRKALEEILDGCPGYLYGAAWSETYPATPSGSAWSPPVSEWNVPEFSQSLEWLLELVAELDDRTNETSRFEDDGEGLEVLEDFFDVGLGSLDVIIDGLDRDSNVQPQLWLGSAAYAVANEFGAFATGALDADDDYADVWMPGNALLWVEWWNAAQPALDMARIIEIAGRLLQQLFVVDHIFDPVLRQAMMGDPTGKDAETIEQWQARFSQFSASVRDLLEAAAGPALFTDLPALTAVDIETISPGDIVFPSPGEILALTVRQVLTDAWVEYAVAQGANRDALYAVIPWMAQLESRAYILVAFGQIVDSELPSQLATGAASYLGITDGTFPLRKCLRPDGNDLPIPAFFRFIAEGATTDPPETEAGAVLMWATDTRTYSTSQVFDSLEPDFLEVAGADDSDLDDEIPDDLEPDDEPGIMGDDGSGDDGREEPFAP